MARKHVLFLCTGNSCRSQMAEALVNHDLGDRWIASSAGTEPAGYVHPLAVQAMTELGIDISGVDGADGNSSEHVDVYRTVAFDQVITVCDDAAENCPVWLGEGNVTHISFPDPARALGDEAEQMLVFRQVRDDIRERIIDFLK